MIASLIGRPQIVGDKFILQTSSGIGFLVNAEKSIWRRVDLTSDQDLEIYTYTFVREDRLELYGFADPANLQLFELLITVSGLGPKTAIALFDQGGASRIVEAVQQAELTFFTAAPRVGKKLAQKIVIELKTKLGGFKELDLGPKSQNYQDVKDGLLSLGYNEDQIEMLLTSMVDEIENQDIGLSIKQAIKKLSQM